MNDRVTAMDWAMIAIYFLFVLGVGFTLRRHMRTSADFFTTCIAVTVVVSVATAPRTSKDLEGLVYSLTVRPQSGGVVSYARPAMLGLVALAASVVLNVLFW
jgi:hypothetical protein